MAPKRNKFKVLKGFQAKLGDELPTTPATSFITFHLKSTRARQQLRDIGKSELQQRREAQSELNALLAHSASFVDLTPKSDSTPSSNPPGPHTSASERPVISSDLIPANPEEPPDMKTRGAWDQNRANPNRIKPAPSSESFDVRSDSGQDDSSHSKTSDNRGTANRNRKPDHRGTDEHDDLSSHNVKKRRTGKQKSVSFNSPDLTATYYNDKTTSSSSSPHTDTRSDKENQDDMEAPDRPRPKLKLSFAKPAPTSASPVAATPTPTLKLKIGGNKGKDGSAKKRKREDDDAGKPMATPLSAAPKIKLKTSVVAQSPITPGGINLKTKGRVVRRELGVGYDSELSDRERDPVMLEGIMLRMQPGPDCDYIKDAISKGTMGVSKLQGGADIGIRVLDDMGRRCIVRVRQNNYAATLVDLPCLIEGMKSWDNKRFIKSIDVCQMMLVLGRVANDEQAKTYPLPDGVDPKSYRYAHGITAPMQWVRKRRFERTKRTPAWEIEAMDRRVNQLLAADASALSSTYELLDHDPRLDQEQYSEEGSEEEDEDEDADGEEEDGYFPHNAIEDDAAHEVGEAEVNDFEALLEGGDDDEDDDTTMAEATSFHHVDSSGFATSNADSPDVTGSAAPTAAATPAGDASTPADPFGNGEDSDGDDGDDDDDADHGDEQNEQDEQKAATKERIQTLQSKIDQETKALKGTTNGLLRRRIAQKIQGMQADVDMLKRDLGDRVDGEADGEGEGGDGGEEGEDGG